MAKWWALQTARLWSMLEASHCVQQCADQDRWPFGTLDLDKNQNGSNEAFFINLISGLNCMRVYPVSPIDDLAIKLQHILHAAAYRRSLNARQYFIALYPFHC
jgi:hypothetical protein